MTDCNAEFLCRLNINMVVAVSYTHLDVYKRQMLIRELKRNTALWEGGRNVLRKALQDNSTTKSRSLWADAWRRFKKNKMAIISLVFLLLLALTGVSTLIIDWVTDDKIYDSLVISQDLSQRFVPPSSEHVLGLDEFGRDILLRILWGTRYSPVSYTHLLGSAEPGNRICRTRCS